VYEKVVVPSFEFNASSTVCMTVTEVARLQGFFLFYTGMELNEDV
jgi:hypothetical protein